MELENIGIIVTVALVVLIAVFLFKKFVALAIAACAILLIFNVGFVMNGAEIRSFFQLDDYISTEQADAIESAFDDFDNKREEFGVVDTDKIVDGMEDAVASGTAIIIQGIGQIDIVTFAQKISDALLEVGTENIDMEELKSSIKNKLSGIKDSDLNTIMDMIETNISSNTEK